MQVNLKAPDKNKLIEELKNDAIMNPLMKADYSQVDTWVDNNLTDVAMMQAVMKRVLKSIKYLLTDLIKEAGVE